MKLLNRAFTLATAAIVVGCSQPRSGENTPLVLNENNVKEVVAALTTDEKIALTVGIGEGLYPPPGSAVFNKKAGHSIEYANDPSSSPLFTPEVDGCIWGVPRLGIKSTVMGGVAVSTRDPRDTTVIVQYTAFPAQTSMAATWNTDLMERVGEAVGVEVRESNVDIMLEPGLNIQRNPMCGRNFEYFSEDPLLTGKMSAAYVRGVQSQGVGTAIKHFAVNNQETNRRTYNAVVSQRALREIYLPGYEITVKEARPWSIMTAYNRLNGYYTAESLELLETVARTEWGFDGAFMTDWGGYGSAVAKVRAGNNMLMSGTKAEIDELKEAIAHKTLDEKRLDESVEHLLRFKLKTPRQKGYTPSLTFDRAKHLDLALESAREAMVLLKNDNRTLPLNETVRTVALFGKGSYFFVASGTGSGESKPKHSVTVSEGMRTAGYRTVKSLDDAYGRFVDDILKSNTQGDYFMRRLVPFHDEMVMSEATIAAQVSQSDAAVVTIGRTGGEGHENGYIPLDKTETQLLDDVCRLYHAAGKKVIVILNVGGDFETASWSSKADAILLAFQAGEMGGQAVADVLKGTVNPSGKLPVTYTVKYADVPSAPYFTKESEDGEVKENQVLVNTDNNVAYIEPDGGGRKGSDQALYNEGIYVGYRYFESFGVPTAYEFGYGMSYTTFEYSNLRLSETSFNHRLEVRVTITNTGKQAGKEVAQLYLAAPRVEIDKPMHELKGFVKTGLLAPGQSEEVVFTLVPRSLASFRSGTNAWVADRGDYEVRIGASCRDIRQKATFALPNDLTVERVNNVLFPNYKLNELVSKP